MADLAPLIALEGVSRQFGSDPPVHALRAIDLTVTTGEWLAIVGPSGSGKSTLLNIIGCLDRQSSGSYRFLGIDVADLGDKRRAGLRSSDIGFVFQSFHLLAHRTVLENVMLSEVYRKESWRGRRERASEALDRVQLGHRADFFPTKLSGGERQRVAIARALMGSPKVLLCDEPTGNLDSQTTTSLLQLLDQLHDAGLTIVMITHDPDVAERAGRQVRIVDGTLSEQSGHGGISLTSLANRVGQPRSTASATAKRLEKRGYLAKRRRVDDKRRLAIELTASGHSKVAKATPFRPDTHDTAFEDLEPKEWRMLFQLRPGVAPDGPASPIPVGQADEGAGEVSASGTSARDLGNEAIAGLFARPGRMALTVLGTVIGLTALVATLGLSRTASNRIIGRFDELAATEVIVSSKEAGLIAGSTAIPWDASERLARLEGVISAGLLSTVDVGDTLVTTSPISDPQRQTDLKLTVQTASPELFDVVRAEVRTGRLPDEGHSQRVDRVAVLGPNAAERLSINGIDQLPAISIGDDLFSVIGILDDVSRQHQLLAAVLIPQGTAQSLYGLAHPELVVIETQIGAARLITRQAPLALRPDNPTGLRVESPPEPQRVRQAVESDLNVLFLMLGGVSLVVGAIGIANVTLVGVMERTGEIGLRRALGARRSHIASQFLLESSVMGLVGGILGGSLGALLVVAVSAFQEWTPVLDPIVPFAAVLIGGLTGLLSGTYPAVRAAGMEPVEALRSGM